MDNETQIAVENQDQPLEIDSWAAAFDALNKEVSESSAQSVTTTAGAEDTATEGADRDTNSDGTESEHDTNIQADDGGSHSLDGMDSEEYDNGDRDVDEVHEEVDIEAIRSNYRNRAENQVIAQVAKEFVDRGVRNRNGVLGARIDDPDIMKRDEDGVPHFYNPDTGREFTGDNPRRQASEWCEDYNRELARAYNTTCKQRVDAAMKDVEPQIRVIEFSETYNKLDPIRKSMFDSIVEDYEIKDKDGNAIGYSCDLNKALQAVDRQVAKIQEYAKANAAPASTNKKSGPALDMKNSSNAGSGQSNNPKPKSLAEAMEYAQNKQLDSLKGNK